MTAQRHGGDDLGWALDQLLEYARGNLKRWSPCPKAIARAHAQLLRERSMAAQIAAGMMSAAEGDQP
jgi:hypothetical protein